MLGRLAAIVIAFVLVVSAVAQQERTPESLFAQYPPDEDQLDPGMHWAPQFVGAVEKPGRGRVRVKVDWADNALEAAAVTFGVPFADGALPSVHQARLITADGTEVPAQFDQMATWWRRTGPVRWALVSATLQRDRQYFIEYGSAVRRANNGGMTVEERADAMVINTGPMRAAISKVRPTLLEECAVDRNGDGRFEAAETIITPELAAANLPTVVDGRGNECPASTEDFAVSFVRRGPMQTVIRREGWYVRGDGTRYCQFITYSWFDAGQSTIRYDHTLVVAFDSTQNQIRDLRVTVPLRGPGTWAGVFAATDQPFSGELSGPSERFPRVDAAACPARLVQDAREHFNLRDARGRVIEGAHAGGWCGVLGSEQTAFLGVRDFWQQYPMELEVAADGFLIAHLWPAHEVEPLDFTPSKVMGAEYPGDQIFWQRFYEGGLDAWTQAYGVAKTHNLCIAFAGPGASAAAAANGVRAFCVAPVIAHADPVYACATEAFGRVHPEDRAVFPDLEKIIDALIYRKYWLRNRLGNYGWIHFGDVNYDLVNSTDPARISYGHWRHWAQMFYGGPNVMPLLYMRSGRRDAWDFHRVNARHVMDLDMCHLDNPQFSKVKGGRYGGNGGICHYAADIYNLGCDCHLRFMLWDWYLNGNPRAWEVAREFMDHYLATRHDPYHARYQHRMTGGAVRFHSEAYEATWDPRHLSCMRQHADTLYKAQAELGFTRYDDVYMNEGKVKYYQLTGDRRMLGLFLNDMRVTIQRRDCDVFADTRHTILWGLAHAYWFTGDRDFLPYAAWQLAIVKTRIPVEGEPWQIGATPWTFEHAYLSTVGNQLPVFMALMRDAGELPVAVGPSGKGSGPVCLLEQRDQQIELDVEVQLQNVVPGLGAADWPNWQQWFGRLEGADRPLLVLIAPDGSEVAQVDLVAQMVDRPALAADTGMKVGLVTMTAPADGQTGTYILRPTSPRPICMQIMRSNLVGRVHHTGDAWVYGSTHHFRVPAGTRGFRIQLKAITLRTEVEFTVRDPQGEERAKVSWQVGSDCRHDWESIELDAGAPEQDESWSISGIKPMAVFLRFEGVPPFVGGAPDELFVPQRTLELPAIELPQGEAVYYVAGPAGMGRAAALPPRVGLKLTSPNGTALLNEHEGTVEMWVKDARDHSDLHNRSLIRCGALNLYRRMNLGTYLYIGSVGHQTGFLLSPNRWTHLAVTWRPAAGEGELEVAIYADGVRIGSSYTSRIKPEAGWAGTELLIPADTAGLFVDELRLSEVARYTGNFDRPAAPFAPDEHTRVLCHFEEDLAARALGQQTAFAAY